jgi:hypothetical protein
VGVKSYDVDQLKQLLAQEEEELRRTYSPSE